MSNNINLEDQVSELERFDGIDLEALVSELNPIQFKHFKEVYTSENITKYELTFGNEQQIDFWEDFKRELFNKRLPSFWTIEPKEAPEEYCYIYSCYTVNVVIAKGQELAFKYAIESINYANSHAYAAYYEQRYEEDDKMNKDRLKAIRTHQLEAMVKSLKAIAAYKVRGLYSRLFEDERNNRIKYIWIGSSQNQKEYLAPVFVVKKLRDSDHYEVVLTCGFTSRIKTSLVLDEVPKRQYNC